MKKIVIAMALMAANMLACTSVFINKGDYSVVGRSMDFGMNMGFNVYMGYIGQENTTDIVVDAGKIPDDARLSWKNQYGFAGRSAFNTPIIVDGLNTEGLSVAILYLPGATYPDYNPSDSRQALSIYDLSNYVLGNAKNVDEARRLIEDAQVVNAAIEAGNGVYATNLPIHHILRDKDGNTLVVEFHDKKINLYEGEEYRVVTNAPQLYWQIDNAKQYASLKITNTHANAEFENRMINYKEIYNFPGMRAEQTALMGLPADYTPPSRFVRAQVLVDNMPAPQNRAMAYNQAQSIINTVIVPPLSEGDVTLWTSIQDLKELKYIVKDLIYHNPDGSLYAFDPTEGYRVFDLNNIDFKTVPMTGAASIQVTPPAAVKKIVDVTKPVQ
jgi:choloylglycine hydrolase